jgi:transcriptional regulator with XRE-family HTH domain
MQNDTRAPVLTNRVRERRKALGLTQGELAARAGCTRQTVIRIESQEQYDVAKLLCLQLARALDVEESWLFVERAPDEAAS